MSMMSMSLFVHSFLFAGRLRTHTRIFGRAFDDSLGRVDNVDGRVVVVGDGWGDVLQGGFFFVVNL